jgi:hypothetical protein
MNWTSIKTTLASRWFGDVIDARVQQAVTQVRQAIPSLLTYDASMAGFRRLVGNHHEQTSLRDLPMPTQERMQEIAYYLFLTNPMAEWRVKMLSSYILGKGVTPAAKDKRTDVVVQAHWSDPLNNWPVKLENKTCELSIYGEQCWPVFIAPGTGRLRLGYLDPALIGQVVLDPDNAEQPIGIITKTWTNYRPQPERRYRVILDVSDEELTPLARQMRDEFTDGTCFYFAVNKVSNGSRGISDLLSKADWLDGYEQFLFNRLERADLANRVLFDMEFAGLTEDEIKEKRKTLGQPQPGSWWVHNEKVKLNVSAPKLEAADAAVDARLFKHQCLAGYPEHWYGGGGDVNRATAGEMDEPTFKLLETRQQFVKNMLLAVLRHAVREAKRVGMLRQTADETIDLPFPEMVKADMPKLADTFEKVSRTANLNVTSRLMTKAEGRQLIAIATKPLGVDLVPMTDDDLDALANEDELDDATADYRSRLSGPNDQTDKTDQRDKTDQTDEAEDA